jgi:hypothetical protein
MRLGPLAGLLLTVAPMPVSADMISDPTVNGRVVDYCPAINGSIDCQRAMTAATAVCKEYGFRRADSYHLRQISIRAVRLRLSIDNQESVYHSDWMTGDLGPSFDEIDCSK